ncbi:hypothetical protein [uncultured Ruminococcus sp.]|uniref:hypothetical protein n=1 Tax=uncultured Ruminococcus sp. TaxID=165186 RepID=UPI0025FA4C98|nr:hypothetical protein [uncultured Ruminococcus sp.]
MNISYNEFFAMPCTEMKMTHLICTTMSMSAEEQLRIIACKFGVKSICARNSDRLIEHSKGKFFFYFDDRKTDMQCSVMTAFPKLTAALLDMDKPAPSDSNVFHPKIMLARYAAGDDVSYRALISSRNLTSADVFETGVMLVSAPRRNDAPNHNIHELLEYLDDPETKELADEIKGLDLILPDECSSVKITVSGINGQPQDRELVDILKKEENDTNKRLYILSPDYETAQDKLERHRVYAPQKTHAKLYYLPDADGGTVWLGSCNLSDSAMNGKNIECMAKITNVGKYFSVDSDNDIFTVFGTKCERVTEARKFDGSARYEVIKKLSEFVQSSEFSGEDSLKTWRIAKVQIETRYTIKGKEVIEYLPLGFPEKDNNKDEPRWRNINIKNSYTFRAGKKYVPNGMLRVRLTENGMSAEKIVIFDKDAYSSIYDKTLSADGFFAVPWLDHLMLAEDRNTAEYEKAHFLETLEKTADIMECTDSRKAELNGLKEIYESVFKELRFEE